MHELTLARSVAILREKRQERSERYVDLAISLRVCSVDRTGDKPKYIPDTDEELVELGGRWDRRAKRWDGEARRVQVVRVPRGGDQEQPARWLAEWFRRQIRGQEGKHWDEPTTIPGRISVEFRRVWTLLLVGGRRGGKSHLAIVALVMMAASIPRSILWAISPTQEETDELETAVRAIAPRRWFSIKVGKTNKTTIFKFANGSRIMFLSGHKPRGLKRGRVDVALYNEAQNMSKTGWTQLRGAIADRAGLVVLACNPPLEAIGRWIEDVYAQARAKAIDAEAFTLRGSNNPFITAEALEAMRRETDEVTARKDIDGEMGVPIGDTVLHAWSDAETIRTVPDGFIDITAEVTRRELGRPFGYIVGMDFQQTPHMVAVFYKLFRDPADPLEVLAWIIDEVVIDNANEYELCDAMEGLDRWTPAGRVEGDGYRGWLEKADNAGAPVHCCVIADASGWYQDGEHQKGQKSDRRLAERGWTFAFKPQKDSDANPRISERVGVTNARLKNAGEQGKRRLFALPHCLRVIKAMREWENHKLTGAPNKHSVHAHCCDAATYPIYRLFGRAKVKGGGGYRSIGKRTRAEDLKGL